MKLVHVETKHQLADMLTKTQSKATFLRHVETLFGNDLKPPKATTKQKQKRVGMCHCVSCFVGGASFVAEREEEISE